MDVLCRAIGASLFVSHGIRRDVETHLLLQNAVHLSIRGDRVKRLNPDERSTAALIKHALAALSSIKTESSPGITVAPADLAGLLAEWGRQRIHPVVLDEEGTPFDEVSVPENPLFVLSDHLEFTESDEAALDGCARISLGRQALHTSQAITIVHYLLDRQDEDRGDELVLIHKVWGEPKAQILKALLADFDIPVNVMTHVPPSVLPMVLNGLAEAQIWVRKRDVDRAKRIIEDYFEVPDPA